LGPDGIFLDLGKYAINTLNKQDRMAFPFWIYFDSKEKTVWKAESTGTSDRVLDLLDDMIAPPKVNQKFHSVSRVVYD